MKFGHMFKKAVKTAATHCINYADNIKLDQGLHHLTPTLSPKPKYISQFFKKNPPVTDRFL